MGFRNANFRNEINQATTELPEKKVNKRGEPVPGVRRLLRVEQQFIPCLVQHSCSPSKNEKINVIKLIPSLQLKGVFYICNFFSDF